MNRAYHSSSIQTFINEPSTDLVGKLTLNHPFDLNNLQRDAWLVQIILLQNILSKYEGEIFFEYIIPRMGKRIDVILIINAVIYIVEFKVNADDYTRHDNDQVVDYALDLRNFHEGSHKVTLAPILVATHAKDAINNYEVEDGIYYPLKCNAESLLCTIDKIQDMHRNESAINIEKWKSSGYKPTPTIIEATLALYNGHSVDEISRSDAGRYNLSKTTTAISKIIEYSKANHKKSIVFVTGVPGAGKTLVGLDIATTHLNPEDELYSVFLSGNGPLVKILQEALTRDKVAKAKEKGERLTKKAAYEDIKSVIQNVHHFRDDCLADANPPAEHVAIFDEAQRAWNLEKTCDFMRRKKGRCDFSQSEPDYLISCLDRHDDWAVVICLVGGGQEIHTGEAGIGEWLQAIQLKYKQWDAYLTNELTDSEYEIDNISECTQFSFDQNLHLRTSARSFRSENVSFFVKSLLDIDKEEAGSVIQDILRDYPIMLTRDFEQAKFWVREQSKGSERYGMIVSSNAERLKPYAINVKAKTDPVHWFLDSKEDVRSSYYLEDVATEFQVQGLELDWVCMAWDADFRFDGSKWRNWQFKGSKWQRINKDERKLYQKNAYRVLLTRARQGMVIVVPHGDPDDHTRLPEFYNPTYQYLSDIGLEVI